MIPWRWNDFAIILGRTYQTDYAVFNQQISPKQKKCFKSEKRWDFSHVKDWVSVGCGHRVPHASGGIPLELLPLESAPPSPLPPPPFWRQIVVSTLHQSFKTLKFIITFHQQNNLVALQILRFGIIFRKESKMTTLTTSKPCVHVIMFWIV